MYTTVVVILSLSCIFFGDVQATSNGAVGSVACADAKMDPSPGHGTTHQTSDSPYNVQTSETSYVPGGKLTVTLRGTQSFKGFMVLALPASDDSAAPLGSFEDTGVLSQAVCIGGSTHTTSFSQAPPADTIDLTWNAPSTDVGDVIFYATFVKQQSQYWVKVPSAVVSAPSTPEPPVAITTTTTADTASPSADSTSPSADSSTKASTDKPQGGESGDATKEGDDTNKGDDNSKGKGSGKRNSGTRHHGFLIALRDVISWLFCLIWY